MLTRGSFRAGSEIRRLILLLNRIHSPVPNSQRKEGLQLLRGRKLGPKEESQKLRFIIVKLGLLLPLHHVFLGIGPPGPFTVSQNLHPQRTLRDSLSLE